MPKFRKKPVVIEAVQWKGHNTAEIADFLGTSPAFHIGNKDGNTFYIETLEGTMKASDDDWIIKGVNGEFYPCKPDIFEKTYDPVQSDS